MAKDSRFEIHSPPMVGTDPSSIWNDQQAGLHPAVWRAYMNRALSGGLVVAASQSNSVSPSGTPSPDPTPSSGGSSQGSTVGCSPLGNSLVMGPASASGS